MIETGNLLRKIGFYKTLEILSIKGDSITLREFYERLYKEESYYNAFLRVKDEMVSKGLIVIHYGEESYIFKRIKLTEKGILAKQTLRALLELIG